MPMPDLAARTAGSGAVRGDPVARTGQPLNMAPGSGAIDALEADHCRGTAMPWCHRLAVLPAWQKLLPHDLPQAGTHHRCLRCRHRCPL